MKKLHVMFFLVFSFLTSFAHNGENEKTLILDAISVNKMIGENSTEFVSEYNRYEITLSFQSMDIEIIAYRIVTECIDINEFSDLIYSLEVEIGELAPDSDFNLTVIPLGPCIPLL